MVSHIYPIRQNAAHVDQTRQSHRAIVWSIIAVQSLNHIGARTDKVGAVANSGRIELDGASILLFLLCLKNLLFTLLQGWKTWSQSSKHVLSDSVCPSDWPGGQSDDPTWVIYLASARASSGTWPTPYKDSSVLWTSVQSVKQGTISPKLIVD